MTGEQKVLLTTLWHRTSAAGNEYLSGFLGKARVIGFRGEPTADGIPTWDLYLQAPEPRAAAAPRRAPARRTSRPRPPADDGDPRPFDDDVSDVGQ